MLGKKMKICVIGTRGFPKIEGGVEKHCELLYPLLAEKAEIVVFRRKPYVCENTRYENIRFVDLPSTKIKGVEAVLHSFLSAIGAIRMHPDAVHFHNIGPAMFAPLVKLFSIPVVLTYHSPNYEHKKWGWFAKELLRFSEGVALKYADRIIFVNRFQMVKYPKEIQEKSSFIPNGISTPKSPQSCNYLDELGVQPGKYILSVGRITPEKGFHTLIEAFRDQTVDGYKLVIAGGVEFESGYMQKLQKLAEDIPVIFTGYVFGEALAQLYTNAALFVLASENEGFPLVLLEAMSYGLDVLVSDIPATHLVELEKADYFQMGDKIQLGKEIRRKLQQPQNRSYALSQYDWQVIAKHTTEVICSAIGTN